MKHALSLLVLALALPCAAFDCQPFGPAAPTLNCANFLIEPLAVGALDASGYSQLFLFDAPGWSPYYTGLTFLPITSICCKDANTLMLTIGAGSYSDGIYNFDLTSHTWSVNEWFYLPGFVLRDPLSGTYYTGDQTGLHRSIDGANWTQISELGQQACTSFACRDNHAVANCGNGVYYSSDSGQTWQASTMILLEGFRFASDGALYGFMDAGSDSDGLWRSDDFGANWDPVIYSEHLSNIGPDYSGHLVLGWNQPNELGGYLALLTPQHTLMPLAHPDLNSPVKQLDVFPLINTPSFYVINGQGLYYLTSFLNVSAEDELAPPPESWLKRIWPNPAKNSVNLELAESGRESLSLNLYDLRGRKVLSEQVSAPPNGLLDLNLPELDSGLYLLKVAQGRRTALARIVIRQ